MNIQEIYEPQANKLEMQKLRQEAKRSEGASYKDMSIAGDDKVSISREAKGMQHTDKVVRDKLAVIPDVRMEKVQAAKAKLSEGFYNRGENIEEAADAFLKQSPAADEVRTKAAVNELMNKMDELPEARNEEVSNAKNRAYLGEYNREEPIRKVSDNLWIPPLKRL